ncbi:UNVERIFIED_CONTAM: hypothetical protein K2H54_048632 [Gekko kuhli]
MVDRDCRYQEKETKTLSRTKSEMRSNSAWYPCGHNVIEETEIDFAKNSPKRIGSWESVAVKSCLLVSEETWHGDLISEDAACWPGLT